MKKSLDQLRPLGDEAKASTTATTEQSTTTTVMESSSKRRKLAHAETGIKHNGLIDFASRKATQVSTASTFVLQADELLSKTKLDYKKTLGDVDGHLHRLKGAIEAIPPHDPVSVCTTCSSKRDLADCPDPRSN